MHGITQADNSKRNTHHEREKQNRTPNETEDYQTISPQYDIKNNNDTNNARANNKHRSEHINPQTAKKEAPKITS